MKNSTFQNIFSEENSIGYPLEWIDRLATVSLNPENIENINLEPEKVNEITKYIKTENEKLQMLIKSQVFALLKDEDIGMLIRRYHSSLLMVLDQSVDNQKTIPESNTLVLNLYTSIISCLRNLLTFIESRFAGYLGKEEKEAGEKRNRVDSVKRKITCALSSDQIGLIIRAADESRLIVAKSMNEVFKTIIPHLSTPWKEDLSYNSVRTRSYAAEDGDKQIAIQILEKMIRKIKGY